MSTGLSCDIFEIKGLGFFYAIENHMAPAAAWDWHEEDPYVGGPHPSEDAAFLAGSRRHGNPGHSNLVTIGRAALETKPVIKGLIEKAMGKPLGIYTPPNDGEEVAADFQDCGVFVAHGVCCSSRPQENNRVVFEHIASMRDRTNVLSSATVSMLLKPEKIEISIQADKNFPKQVLEMIEERARWAAGRLNAVATHIA